MSRSNPTENLADPSTRWFEWNGEKGKVRYYDKAEEQTVTLDLPFSFLVLDQLSTVTGWDEPGKCRIYANRVRNINRDTLTVKSKASGVLAEGVYRDIKPAIEKAGGQFAFHLYIAYETTEGELALGSLLLKGAAAGAWMEFEKRYRTAIQKDGVLITDAVEGKKGRVVFYTPVFGTTPTSSALDAAALALDRELQPYLTAYLDKGKTVAPEAVAPEPVAATVAAGPPAEVTEDDLPF